MIGPGVCLDPPNLGRYSRACKLWLATMSFFPTLDSFTCVAALAALAYAPHVVKAYTIVKSTGRYSLHNPRETVARAVAELGPEKEQARLISRLQSCHNNHLEHFPIAAAAVLMAAAAGVDRAATNAAATAIVAARVVHFVAYWQGAWGVRSAAFVLGVVPVGFLFYTAAAAHAKA